MLVEPIARKDELIEKLNMLDDEWTGLEEELSFVKDQYEEVYKEIERLK